MSTPPHKENPEASAGNADAGSPPFTTRALDRLQVLSDEFGRLLRDRAVLVARQRDLADLTIVPSDVEEAHRTLLRPPPRRQSLQLTLSYVVTGLGTSSLALAIQGILLRSTFWLAPGVLVPTIVAGVSLLTSGILLFFLHDRQ